LQEKTCYRPISSAWVCQAQHLQLQGEFLNKNVGQDWAPSKWVARNNQHLRMAKNTCSAMARTYHLPLSSPSLAVKVWAKLFTLNTFTHPQVPQLPQVPQSPAISPWHPEAQKTVQELPKAMSWPI
jgi:hypothetical protein